MGLKKVQKQGMDENTRRLFCCRKVVIKKDWKTTLPLLQSLSLPQLFFLVSVVFFWPIPTCT